MIGQRLIRLATPDPAEPCDQTADFGVDSRLRGSHANSIGYKLLACNYIA